MRFTDTVALITGGGTGIGKSAAIAFAEEGASVVVVGLDEEPLQRTVEEIEARDGKAEFIVGDVANETTVKAAVETAATRFGRLDVAFNNAGVMVAGTVADIDRAAWDRATALLTGTWLSMKYEVAYMRDHGGGAIVNMSSIIGVGKTIPGTGAYGAAKAAISSLTRTAALENIAAGVRINSVSPGPIATAFSLIRGENEAQQAERMKTALPIGRVGAVDEVVGTVLWLASTDAGFAVGTDIVIDGGATV